MDSVFLLCRLYCHPTTPTAFFFFFSPSRGGNSIFVLLKGSSLPLYSFELITQPRSRLFASNFGSAMLDRSSLPAFGRTVARQAILCSRCYAFLPIVRKGFSSVKTRPFFRLPRSALTPIAAMTFSSCECLPPRRGALLQNHRFF